MNYLLLYLEETYGLTSEKKITAASGSVANENGYHPVRDYLNGLSSVSYTHLDVYKRQDMLPGDVAQRPAAGKWRNPDRSERTNGNKTPL